MKIQDIYAVRKLYCTWKQMNSKTFYTCSTESSFLKYKKISKKAVKIGSFPQCSVHTYLGHDGCF